ncbi:uncharacterized protein [Epargyreus clarus]|uniref:uncharacterized protein n=1 Tax=Epargyreus clarus TaxID=520877 RepID=UPI003C2AAF29
MTSTTTKQPFKCVEEERPSNIGPYEVPTQQDLVLFTKNMLLETFNSYNTDAFYLLKDIKEVTKTSMNIENKCLHNKLMYRRCVKRISTQCEQITKNLVKNLENQKQEISELTEDRICNLADMKTDPIQVMMSLAQEKVSLQFALPRFLRLLSGCSTYCVYSRITNEYKNKPMRHMTDQDLVIKHFLTHKNYLELIMDSRHKTMANSN